MAVCKIYKYGNDSASLHRLIKWNELHFIGAGNCNCPGQTVNDGSNNCACPGDTVRDGADNCNCLGQTLNDGANNCTCPGDTISK